MLAWKSEETCTFSDYALSFLWIKGRFKNVDPASFIGMKFAKKCVKEAKKLMLGDRLLMHCAEIFKNIPFRNDSSYVSYIFLFLCTFSFLQSTGKQDPRCLRVNLLLLPIPHLQSIFSLCDNHSYEFIYTAAVPRGPSRDQHFIYKMQQNIALSRVTFFLNKGWKNISSYSHFTDGELKTKEADSEKDLDNMLTAT